MILVIVMLFLHVSRGLGGWGPTIPSLNRENNQNNNDDNNGGHFKPYDKIGRDDAEQLYEAYNQLHTLAQVINYSSYLIKSKDRIFINHLIHRLWWWLVIKHLARVHY